jgi:hypothetical protein
MRARASVRVGRDKKKIRRLNRDFRIIGYFINYQLPELVETIKIGLTEAIRQVNLTVIELRNNLQNKTGV